MIVKKALITFHKRMEGNCCWINLNDNDLNDNDDSDSDKAIQMLSNEMIKWSNLSIT